MRVNSLSKDLLIFLWKRKLWWLAPIIILLIVVGVILIFGESSVISPFIYALF